MKKPSYGFGVDPGENQSHFYVWCPPKETKAITATSVQVYERPTWPRDDEGQIRKTDRLRIEVSKHKWGVSEGRSCRRV